MLRQDVLVGRQVVPLGLVVEGGGRELDHHLAEEVVGAVVHVIPHGDLENAQLKVCSANARVHEGLVPPRLRRVCYRARPTFRLLTGHAKMDTI